MKFENEHGVYVTYKGIDEQKLSELSEIVNKCLEVEPFVLVCIVGNKGIGKSTFGRFLRKTGFGNYKSRDIAVIDDDCMSIDVLYFFRRKYVNPCLGVDELKPFFKYCRKKRVRFYIKSDPETRISKASILMRLRTGDETRLKRLIKRKGYEAGNDLFLRTKYYSDAVNISYKHELEADI